MPQTRYLLFGLAVVIAGLFAWAFFAQTDTARVAAQRASLPDAAPLGSVEDGRDLAVTYCGSCHGLDRSRVSPIAEAPPFREVVDRWPVEYLAEALAEGIAVDHGSGVEMPEFAFESDQIDDLLAYLDSLR